MSEYEESVETNSDSSKKLEDEFDSEREPEGTAQPTAGGAPHSQQWVAPHSTLIQSVATLLGTLCKYKVGVPSAFRTAFILPHRLNSQSPAPPHPNWTEIW